MASVGYVCDTHLQRVGGVWGDSKEAGGSSCGMGKDGSQGQDPVMPDPSLFPRQPKAALGCSDLCHFNDGADPSQPIGARQDSWSKEKQFPLPWSKMQSALKSSL